MLSERPNPVIEPSSFDGNLWTGSWQPSSAGTADVLDKASGTVIGRVGIASAADVAAACATAAAAADVWAAVAPSERAAIMTRAADALEAATDEVVTWIVRETGAIRPKGEFEVHAAATELREAGRLALHEVRHVIEKTDESKASRCAFRLAWSG
jgi:benzaldehyde dehydrogenase (NAD)